MLVGSLAANFFKIYQGFGIIFPLFKEQPLRKSGVLIAAEAFYFLIKQRLSFIQFIQLNFLVAEF